MKSSKEKPQPKSYPVRILKSQLERMKNHPDIKGGLASRQTIINKIVEQGLAANGL